MKTWQKRTLAVVLSVILGALAIFGLLELSVVYSEKSWEHWSPNYAKEDISALVRRENKTEADYEFLYAQTGLTKLGIDGLTEIGDYARIQEIQDFYFEDHTVNCKQFYPYTFIETLESYATYARLQTGDLIVSATTHVTFMRVGHAVLVVDGEGERIVESLGIGSPSRLTYASTCANLANFIVLRPTGIPTEVRAKAAEYAKAELLNKPYDFTVGILKKKFPDVLESTQCAHLCWYAYKKFGYDIDGNGGGLVQPRDISKSPYMEVVQTFGFNPDTLWR